ncbi:MAG: hypothetical protein KGZ57_11985 [Dethiobacter sp.]|nr:hypothetical protein [Dethiobacter sp.]
MGTLIGDIVGSRFEFNNHRSKDFDLFWGGCFVTDDSIMLLSVAKAIMDAEKAREPSITSYRHDHEFYALINDFRINRGGGFLHV